MGINDYQKIKCFEESFLTYFSNKKGFEVNLIDKLPLEEACDNINSFVQFGWKSEAVPFIPEKKSLIARFLTFLIELFVIFRNISCFNYNHSFMYNAMDAKNISTYFKRASIF